MKIYKRQIRPMIQPPCFQGFSCKPYPVIDENDWYDEDKEEELQEKYKETESEGGWCTLFFDERFIEI